MFEIWVPITIAAALAQNVRSSLQKHLKGALTTAGATYVRFLFAVPFVLIYLLVLTQFLQLDLPTLNRRFLFFAALGGIGQILGTALLIHLFSFRNFVVGTAFSKTETVQAALFGFLALSDPITFWAMVAIGISLVGVLLLAVASEKAGIREVISSMIRKTTVLGFASGAFFGIAAVSYRAASLSLESGFVISAAVTLVVVLVLQTVAMTIYLFLREPGQLAAVAGAWKVSSVVGLAGMTGSTCWFTAMTIQNAAHVRALGQVELFFTFLSSLLFFREKINSTELFGVSLLVCGIGLLLLWA